MKAIKTVLLIDDDEPTNFINKKIIKSSGFVENIHVAQSGQEALNFLSRQDIPNPEIIFLDINMPAMDGWEFLTQYKKLTQTQKGNMLIVMLTTSLNPDDEMKAKEINEVHGFNNKPLTVQMLKEIITKYF